MWGAVNSRLLVGITNLSQKATGRWSRRDRGLPSKTPVQERDAPSDFSGPDRVPWSTRHARFQTALSV
ncbi:hypothetical protein CSUI_007981 [Cystoisospora suis]|uniref:Uncharacterized protein n=1 Tax=Cystoisospora suis TaxID=483139 RepID=A0A2C6KP71_9APIC|nr:hypothetical protein CSUI_007981 [Cystoisospora suis]